jgi:hypothetical protein
LIIEHRLENCLASLEALPKVWFWRWRCWQTQNLLRGADTRRCWLHDRPIPRNATGLVQSLSLLYPDELPLTTIISKQRFAKWGMTICLAFYSVLHSIIIRHVERNRYDAVTVFMNCDLMI